MSCKLGLVVFVFGLVAVGAHAQNDPSPAERLKALQKDVADAEAAFREAWAKSPDPMMPDEQVGKLHQIFREKQQAGFDAAIAIARAEPKSTDGYDALEWLLLDRACYQTPIGKAAFGLLTEHHAAKPKLGKAIAFLAYYPPYDFSNFKKGDDPSTIPYCPKALALLKAVSEQNPDRTVRGQALLGLAGIAKEDFGTAEFRRKANTDELALTAEREFEKVLKNYGDCPALRTRGARKARPTLGDEAKGELYALRNLRLGKKAPDIDGEDLDGAKFKLSDYQGKVRLLVFWASWCGPCMAQVPHERELVERFKDRPFVLIGVNGDEMKDSARKAVQKREMSWRSFWQNDGASGPIAMAWNVYGWPTIYVIDHTGVIRDRYLRGTKLDEPLEKLVTEAEKASKVK